MKRKSLLIVTIAIAQFVAAQASKPAGNAPQGVSGTITALQGGAWSFTCTAGCGAAGFVDGTTFTIGVTPTTNVGGTFNDSATALAAGTAGELRTTANRALHNNLRNAAGTETGTAGNPLRVDPTGATPQPISATSLPLPTGAASSANQATQITSLTNLDVALSTRTKPSDQQHVVVDTVPSTAVTNAGLTNLDVALSTRTKPSDQQHVIVDTVPSTAVTNAGLTNLDVALSTRTKPSDQQHAIVDSSALPTGAAQDSSLTTIDNDLKAAQPRKIQDSNGNTILTNNGALPVTVVNTVYPPALTSAQLGNPLLYRAALQQYCRTNLCPALPLGK